MIPSQPAAPAARRPLLPPLPPPLPLATPAPGAQARAPGDDHKYRPRERPAAAQQAPSAPFAPPTRGRAGHGGGDAATLAALRSPADLAAASPEQRQRLLAARAEAFATLYRGMDPARREQAVAGDVVDLDAFLRLEPPQQACALALRKLERQALGATLEPQALAARAARATRPGQLCDLDPARRSAVLRLREAEIGGLYAAMSAPQRERELDRLWDFAQYLDDHASAPPPGAREVFDCSLRSLAGAMDGEELARARGRIDKLAGTERLRRAIAQRAGPGPHPAPAPGQRQTPAPGFEAALRERADALKAGAAQLARRLDRARRPWDPAKLPPAEHRLRLVQRHEAFTALFREMTPRQRDEALRHRVLEVGQFLARPPGEQDCLVQLRQIEMRALYAGLDPADRRQRLEAIGRPGLLRDLPDKTRTAGTRLVQAQMEALHSLMSQDERAQELLALCDPRRLAAGTPLAPQAREMLLLRMTSLFRMMSGPELAQADKWLALLEGRLREAGPAASPIDREVLAVYSAALQPALQARLRQAIARTLAGPG